MAFKFNHKVFAMNKSTSISNGRAVIPAILRSQLNLKDGDELIWSLRDGCLVATTRDTQLSRAQALFQKFVAPGTPSLADELISERRLEALGQ